MKLYYTFRMNWDTLNVKLSQLKKFNRNIKNKIHDLNEQSATILTAREEVQVNPSEIANFINQHNIKELIVYGDLEVYDILSSAKIEELEINARPFRIYSWDKLITLVKRGSIKRLNIETDLQENEVKHILELLNIPTLIAIKIQSIEQISESSALEIFNQFKKNYTILDFKIRSQYDSRICKITERNLMIRNDTIHLEVLDFAIALCSLVDIGFGAYVLLEIFDWINWNHLADHRTKISILENVCRFRRILCEARGDQT